MKKVLSWEAIIYTIVLARKNVYIRKQGSDIAQKYLKLLKIKQDPMAI